MTTSYYMVKNGNALYGRDYIGLAGKAIEQGIRTAGWKMKSKAIEQMNEMRSFGWQDDHFEVVKVEAEDHISGVLFDGKRIRKLFRTQILNVATVA